MGKDENSKEVEKILREDAKGKDQETDPKALEKIQGKTGGSQRGNGKRT